MAIQVKKGFSMIEMLVVLAIIGMILAMVGPRVVTFLSKGRVRGTEGALQNIKAALLEYNGDIGHFPKAMDQLLENKETGVNTKKWQGPYVTEDRLNDAWGYPIVFNCPPKVFTASAGKEKKYKFYELISYGPNNDEADEDAWVVLGE